MSRDLTMSPTFIGASMFKAGDRVEYRGHRGRIVEVRPDGWIRIHWDDGFPDTFIPPDWADRLKPPER
jgi:hypothetical protein